ncbi:hypothetical protein [Mycoplasma bradburyae]|uniref:hypothetical protein n=1 Tax=Mycoplasma bradburyae TaxID=2963128 RepID=UPI002341B79B|nr:hypothetical protein [Mycoplasma bradburyae]MDC4182797.1 hypothetical protein [Mycoplasma bradburyae]
MGVELVSNSKNTRQVVVKIRIKFTIESSTNIYTTPVELTVTEFKSLQLSVALILFEDQMATSTKGINTKENKKILDFGNDMFETLVNLSINNKAATTLSNEITSFALTETIESIS